MKKKHLLLILLMTLLAPWAVAQQSLPYSYGFEDNDLSADGWTTTCTSSNSGITSGAQHTGTYGFAFYYSETSGYLVSPLLTGAKNGLDLSFYYKEYSDQYGDEQFQVGYTTDASNTDASTYTYGDVVTASTSWQTYTNSFPSGTVRIAVKYIYNDAFYLFVDDFSFVATPSCKTPTDLTATNLTTESATLGWTAPDPAPDNGYNVRYRTALIEHPYYFDDFETNTLTGWTIYTDGEAPQSNGWYTINPENGLSFSAHSGSYCASAWSWNSSEYDADNWLISPEVPLTGTLRFYVRTNAGYPDEYEVLLSSTGTDEADFDETLQAMAEAPTTGEWEEVSIDLSSYSGNGYIAIHHVSYNQNYLLIDDFGIFDEPTPAGAWITTTSNTNSKDIASLAEDTTYDFEVQSNCGGETSDWVASTFRTLPSCMPVADLAVSDATTTTISLTWTDQNGGAASYIITDGDDNAVTVTNLTTTGCTVIELKANTAYTFKVTADCGSTTETINVRTACDAISSIPYNEGFETDTYYCWDIEGFERWNNATYAHTGSKFIIADGSDDTTPYYAIMPETNADISILMLNFWYYNFNDGVDCGTLYVGYVTDVNDITTFTDVESIDMSSGTSEYIHTNDIVFDGAPVGSRIAFYYEASGETYAYLIIDDVKVEYKPACMRPTDLVVTDPTGHGATFEWIENGSITEDGWQLYFSEDASAISTGYEYPDDVVDADTNPFTVTSGLKPETDYYVWVRSHCEYTGYSPWSDPATFTTTEACPAPTGLAASEVTGTTAKLSWTGTSESYTVKYRTPEYYLNDGLVEDFEGGSMPEGWTKEGNGTWTVGTGDYSSSTGAHGGTYNAKITHGTSGDETYLITPNLDLSAQSGLSVNLWYINRSWSGDNDGFGVYYRVNGGTWNEIFATTEAHSSWTEINEELPSGAYVAKCQFGFKFTDNWGYGVGIDDIAIGNPTLIPASAWQTKNADASPCTLTGLTAETYYEAKVQGDCGSEGTSAESASVFFTTSAACPEQDALVASNIQIHSAVISWDAHGADEWNLRYSNDNGTTWTDITKNVTNPYTLEELNAATDYLVQVQAKCAASDEWSASVAFTTKCDMITTFPWSEDFESYASGNFNATCWVNEHIAGSATTNLFKVYTSTTGTNTTHQLQLPDEQDGNMIKLVLPGMTLPNANYAFFIDVYRSNNYSSYTTEGIRVFASTNGEIEGATELAFIPRVYSVESGIIPAETTANSWYTYALPINMSGTCYIILRGESKYGAATYMDNFMVTACYPVGTLSYDNLASQTVDLHWTLLDDTQDAWQVCINGDETHPIDITESDVVVEGVERTYSMSGLTAETPYTVKVRANCGGGDFGKWSNTVSFTTLAACATPTGLTASNLTMVGADLAWTGSSDVDYYTVQYRTAAYIDTPVMEEEFATTSLPTGWAQSSTLLTDDVLNGTTTITTGSSSWYFGTNNGVFDSHARVNIYGTSCKYWLITPEVSLSSTSLLSFDLALTAFSGTVAAPQTTGTDDKFVVLISTDNMATWTILRQWDNAGSSYVYNNITCSATGENVTFDLSAYAGEDAVIAFYGESTESNADNNLHIDNVTIGTSVPAGAWQTAANDVTEWEYTLTGLTTNVKYDARVYANCETNPDANNATVSFTTMEEHNIVFPAAGNWAAGNFEPTGAPTIDDDVIIRANVTIPNGTNALTNNIIIENSSVITVAAGATLTINGTSSSNFNGSIIVEDGGQLIHRNPLNATVKKEVTAASSWKDDVDGWYLVATPVSSTSIITTFDIEIDFFQYNEPNAYWWAYNGDHSFSYMSRGAGYLHASRTAETVSYPGQMLSTEDTWTSSTMSYTSSLADDVRGFNLMGNPFTRNLVEGDVKLGDETNIAYLTMNDTRTDFVTVNISDRPILVGEGFFIQATAASQSLVFNPTSAKSDNNGYIRIVAGNENGTDNAYINVASGNTLRKFNIANGTKVYVMNGGEDYSAARIDELAGSMPVNFKAAAEGVYTITINAMNLEAKTMILLDNMTGEEIDLLATPSYTFKATPNDSYDRFRLIFDFNTYTGIDELFTNDIFAFQSGNEIYVKGEGELQVFDVMGRMVLNTRINGVERVNVPANAVYIFKLEEKTQKIVVR